MLTFVKTRTRLLILAALATLTFSSCRLTDLDPNGPQLPFKTKLRIAMGLEEPPPPPSEVPIEMIEKVFEVRKDIEDVYASLGLEIQMAPLPSNLMDILENHRKSQVQVLAQADPKAQTPDTSPEAVPDANPPVKPIETTSPENPEEDPKEVAAKPNETTEEKDPKEVAVTPIENPTETPSKPTPPKVNVEELPEIEFSFIDTDKLQKTGVAYSKSGLKDVPLTGRAVRNYRNGQKSLEIIYIKGLSNGVLKRWHPNGKKLLEIEMVDNVPQGTSTEWYSNGKKFRTIHYKDGKIHGTVTIWSEDGELLSQHQYVNGILQIEE